VRPKLVNGTGYRIGQVEIVFVDLVPDYSTTNLAKRRLAAE
jgi:hypothetical protein